MSNYESTYCQTVAANGATGIEAEPAEPEQASAQHYHWYIVGFHVFLAKANPLAQHQRTNQGCRTRRNMDDCATGEVERAQIANPATNAPNPVSEWRINQGRPQNGENHECLKTLAFGK